MQCAKHGKAYVLACYGSKFKCSKCLNNFDFILLLVSENVNLPKSQTLCGIQFLSLLLSAFEILLKVIGNTLYADVTVEEPWCKSQPLPRVLLYCTLEAATNITSFLCHRQIYVQQLAILCVSVNLTNFSSILQTCFQMFP